ncbi:MAG: GNAT family N-acyltransferase [bacterium]|nr:GNAT family N-acyltransferase [bacterium]
MVGLFATKQVKTEQESSIFTHLWSSIWLEQNYATLEDLEEIKRHYAIYDGWSSDFLLLSDKKEVGTARVIWENSQGFPTLTDFRTTSLFSPKSDLCEVTLLTVHRDHRRQGSEAALTLIVAMYQKAMKEKKISGVLIAADHRLWILLRRLGLRFTQIGQSRMYEGSETIPGHILMQDVGSALYRHGLI